MSEVEKQADLAYAVMLIRAIVFPLSLCLPKLVLEAANYYNVESRKVVTNSRQVIIDFSTTGVQTTFTMSKRGEDSGETLSKNKVQERKEALRIYQSLVETEIPRQATSTSYASIKSHVNR